MSGGVAKIEYIYYCPERKNHSGLKILNLRPQLSRYASLQIFQPVQPPDRGFNSGIFQSTSLNPTLANSAQFFHSYPPARTATSPSLSVVVDDRKKVREYFLFLDGIDFSLFPD